MAAVVGIVSGHDVNIHTRRGNQPNKLRIGKPHHEEDIFVTTQGRGGTEAEV